MIHLALFFCSRWLLATEECKSVFLLWNTVWSFLKNWKLKFHMTRKPHCWVYIPKKWNCFIRKRKTYVLSCLRKHHSQWSGYGHEQKMINKMWHKCRVEYYLDRKKPGMLSFPTSCMDLNDIRWSETRYIKTNMTWCHSWVGPKQVDLIKVECHSGYQRLRKYKPGWGGGGEMLSHGHMPLIERKNKIWNPMNSKVNAIFIDVLCMFHNSEKK